jgi:hypothetical protein
MEIKRRKVDLSDVFAKPDFEETRDGFTVALAKVTSETKDQIMDACFKALQLARKISEKSESGVDVEIDDSIDGYMKMSMHASFEFMEDEEVSQMAAILHELMEQLQETLGASLLIEYRAGYCTEAFPLLAEFLFTGDSRIGLFKRLTRLAKTDLSSVHVRGWVNAMDYLMKTKRIDSEEFSALLKLRNMTEEEKVSLLRSIVDDKS